MTNPAPFTAALCALLLCFGFTECDACAMCESPAVIRGEPRELGRVPVGDAQVVVSVDVLDHRAAVDLTFTGGGRGAMPNGVAVAESSHVPVPTVEVRRGETSLALVEHHGNEYTYRVSGTLEEAEADQAAAEAVATTCSAGERMVYRIVGPGFDSGFHGVYVQGDLALHVALSRADGECAAVLAGMPALEDYIATRIRGDDRTACALVAASRGLDAAFDCGLRSPDSTPPALREQLRAGVAEGAGHQPDWEATVFECLTAADPDRPGCLAYVASTTTPERRQEFLSTRPDECAGENCFPFSALVREVARLQDEALCGAVFARVERLAEGGSDGLRVAGRYASELAVCIPAERHEQLARRAFLQDDGTTFDRRSLRCPLEVNRGCMSLSRLGGSYVARTCDAPRVEQARALLASTTEPAGKAAVDSALIVLARCAPDEARAWLTERGSASPTPLQRELTWFGLAAPAPESATPGGPSNAHVP